MAIEFIPALHYSIRWIEKVNNSDIENELKRKINTRIFRWSNKSNWINTKK